MPLAFHGNSPGHRDYFRWQQGDRQFTPRRGRPAFSRAVHPAGIARVQADQEHAGRRSNSIGSLGPVDETCAVVAGVLCRGFPHACYWCSGSASRCCLGGQALGESAHSRFRRFVLIGAGALLFVGIRTWIAVGAHGGKTVVYQFRASPIGKIVLAPFEPFGQLMTANSLGALVHFAVLAAVLDAGLLVLVFLVDKHYIETAIGASERRYAKIQRMRGGSFLSMGAKKTASWHLTRRSPVPAG